MQSYQAVLVPLDGSALSEQALPLALGIAGRSGLCVYLARVLGVESGLGGADDDRIHRERTSAQSELDALAVRLRAEAHVPIATALLDKHDDVSQGVAATLYTFAQAIGIDLVVMTTHGHTGLTRLWLGSVADSLLHMATIPLLLMRPDAPVAGQGFEQILIPLDGGPLAEQAIAPALALGTVGQTTYTLLQIISPLLAEHTVPPYSVGLLEDDAEALRASAHAYLARLVAELAPQGGRFRTQVSVAEPADAILAIARSQPTDLIAMATHGRGVLARTVLGSVADRVVRNADVPVLVYRPAAVQWQHAAPLAAGALA